LLCKATSSAAFFLLNFSPSFDQHMFSEQPSTHPHEFPDVLVCRLVCIDSLARVGIIG